MSLIRFSGCFKEAPPILVDLSTQHLTNATCQKHSKGSRPCLATIPSTFTLAFFCWKFQLEKQEFALGHGLDDRVCNQQFEWVLVCQVWRSWATSQCNDKSDPCTICIVEHIIYKWGSRFFHCNMLGFAKQWFSTHILWPMAWSHLSGDQGCLFVLAAWPLAWGGTQGEQAFVVGVHQAFGYISDTYVYIYIITKTCVSSFCSYVCFCIHIPYAYIYMCIYIYIYIIIHNTNMYIYIYIHLYAYNLQEGLRMFSET